MNIKRFIALTIVISFIFSINFAKGETFFVEKQTRTNHIFPIGYVYHYNDDSKEALAEADKLNSFTPTMAQNGDVLCFTAFADSEVINYYNQSGKDFGIASIFVKIEQIDTCGTCVIKAITEDYIEYEGSFCLYKISDFEDGFYKATIIVKSVAYELSASTWKASDEGGFKEFFFKIGDVGDIIPHNDYPYRLVIKDERYESGQLEFEGKIPYYYSFTMKETGKVLFNNLDEELYSKVKGFEIYIYELKQTFYFDIDELVDFKELSGRRSSNFNVRFVYKDGCFGPVANGAVRVQVDN
jgi:hypothetical protein